MLILKWIAVWKHLICPLNLDGVSSNFFRFRCLSFECPRLGRWLTPCVEKPPLTVSHILNPMNDYSTLSHAYAVYYVIFLRMGALFQQVFSDSISFSISLVMSMVKQLLSVTPTKGCFAAFLWVFSSQCYSLCRLPWLPLMSTQRKREAGHQK